MIKFLARLLNRPSNLDKAETEAIQNLRCQDIGSIRSLKRRATTNGLLAAVDPETRARCEERLAEVVRLRLGA